MSEKWAMQKFIYTKLTRIKLVFRSDTSFVHLLSHKQVKYFLKEIEYFIIWKIVGNQSFVTFTW